MRSLSPPSGSPAVTTWSYNTNRGWLETKSYPVKGTGAEGGSGPHYYYTAGGRALGRVSPRTADGFPNGIAAVVIHNSATLEPDSLGYADANAFTTWLAQGGTPSWSADTTWTHDRRGRIQTASRSGTTAALSYNVPGELLSEAYTGGTLSGLTLSRTYNAYLQREQLTLSQSGSTISTVGSTYQNGGRLDTVTAGSASSAYDYAQNSALVSSLVHKQGTTTRLTTANQHDLMNRLLVTSATLNSDTAPTSKHEYQYKEGGQRIRVTQADGSWWVYQYNAKGEVISGKRYWSDGTPVAGQQFEYGFDDIGNRTETKAGGDAQGFGLRRIVYQADYQNELTQRDTTNRVDVMGVARANATVTIYSNSAGVDRHREYFHQALEIPPGTNLSVTISASVAGLSTETEQGQLFNPANPETFTYDDEGNLTQDGRFNYTWDPANRLTRAESLTSVPSAAKAKVEFSYDWMGRRLTKKAWKQVAGDWSATVDVEFIYDGWNLVGVLDSNRDLVQSFTWGLDLSGTMQGAGGVGGLLSMTVHTGENAGTYFYAYDGHGNVVALVRASDGTVAARYEYGPFHELIRASGPLARENPFLAATKYLDWETGLYYYGYRFYNPSTGRWLSRDPIEETGGVNLYAMLGNNSVNLVDEFGLRYGNPVTGPNGPINPQFPWDPVTPRPGRIETLQWAAWLSVQDRWNPWGTVVNTHEERWFNEHYLAREATSRAIAHFRREIDAHAPDLCKDGPQVAVRVAPFGTDWRLDTPRVQEQILRNEQPPPIYASYWPVQEGWWMGTVIIGDWEYRLHRFKSTRKFLRTEWVAEIAIVDKLGLEGVFSDMLGGNWLGRMGFKLLQFASGPSREFLRGTFTIDGEVDCCKLRP